MGSKTKTASSKGGNKTYGMGPAQSMAMSGNTGLASMSEAQANTIQKGLQNINKATGGNRDTSYQAIGQNIGEVGSKYRRPVDVNKYASQMDVLNRGIEAGGKIVTGPDGIPRLQLSGTGMKTPEGATMLSMMLPNANATAPTLGQLAGDIGRGISGYNSLRYQPGATTPSMVRTAGLADLLAKMAIPGQMAFGIAKDLFQRFYPGQEEETVTPAARPGMVFPASIPSVTGETVDLRTPTIEELVITPVSESGDVTVSGRPDMNIPVSLAGQVQGPQPNYITDFQNKFFYPEDYTIPFTNVQIPSAGRMIENLITGGKGFEAGASLTPEGIDFYNHLVNERGKSQEEAINIIKEMSLGSAGLEKGGMVPPARGPMSQGVASLFKNK